MYTQTHIKKAIVHVYTYIHVHACAHLKDSTDEVANKEHGGEGGMASVENMDDSQEHRGAWQNQKH